MKLLIEKLGESVDETDVYGRTPLMLACLIHDELTGVNIIRLLLSHEASVCRSMSGHVTRKYITFNNNNFNK